MTYERNSGLTPFFGLRREIDRLFDDAFTGRGSGAGTTWRPAVDVKETAKDLQLHVELPGLRPDDIELDVENGMLTIRGQKSEERKEDDEEGRYHLIERSYGSFYRSFQLPQGIDDSQISADFNNGVLKVSIPKAAMAQPRRIEIGSSDAERVGGSQIGGKRDDRGSMQSGRGGSGSQQRDRMVAQSGRDDGESSGRRSERGDARSGSRTDTRAEKGRSRNDT